MVMNRFFLLLFVSLSLMLAFTNPSRKSVYIEHLVFASQRFCHPASESSGDSPQKVLNPLVLQRRKLWLSAHTPQPKNYIFLTLFETHTPNFSARAIGVGGQFFVLPLLKDESQTSLTPDSCLTEAFVQGF
jgi:hypothetical protein